MKKKMYLLFLSVAMSLPVYAGPSAKKKITGFIESIHSGKIIFKVNGGGRISFEQKALGKWNQKKGDFLEISLSDSDFKILPSDHPL